MPIVSPQDIAVRPDGLQLDEDRGFQRRFWRAERIAWGTFAAIMLAALSGLFGGSGPLRGGIDCPAQAPSICYGFACGGGGVPPAPPASRSVSRTRPPVSPRD